MTITDAQYEWNPVGQSPRGGSPGACLVYSRSEHLARVKAGRRGHPHYTLCGGACNVDHTAREGWETLAFMLVDFHTMVVRDGLDPQVVHREFLKIDEYRAFISPDCEGAA